MPHTFNPARSSWSFIHIPHIPTILLLVILACVFIGVFVGLVVIGAGQRDRRMRTDRNGYAHREPKS